jgi:hypothetical protein
VSDYRLLVDWEVIETVNGFPVMLRRAIKDVLVRIGKHPDQMCDYVESHKRGLDLAVHLAKNYAIKYWIDFPDRHVKIIEIVSAD